MKLFDKILYYWHFTKLNMVKTLLFNFKTMPFKTAVKLPVYLYGEIDFYSLKGAVEFRNCEIKRGMVKMGMNKEYLGTVKGASLFILDQNARLIFEGECEFSSNFLLRIGNNAELTLGKNSFIGTSSKIVCIHKITIGESFRLGFESQMIDSDFHFVYDMENDKLSPREKEIQIGNFNWIGNRTCISKGTKTNDYTIVGNSSVLNKDYTDIEDKYVILAGLPAKPVAKNRRRVFSIDIENKLIQFFKQGQKEITDDLRYQITKSFEE